MITSIRKKFVMISAASVFLVFSGIFLLLLIFSKIQLNRSMDSLTDTISMNGGSLPDIDASEHSSSQFFPSSDVITEETQFSIRFFTVWLDKKNQISGINTDYMASIAKEDVENCVKQALKENNERGWISGYRYKTTENTDGKTIVFVNGSLHKAFMNQLITTAFLILIGSAGLILMLTVFLSKYAVRPIAETYEKQKQFITDANHELKTPLTLILSNLDIVESELGKSEWLDDIRSEGERMGLLINQMVTLSRMDEGNSHIALSSFSLSDALSDIISEFLPAAAERNKIISSSVAPGIIYRGDETLIRQLMYILLDNAVKYCDPDGNIRISASQRHNPVIVIENTYADVNNLELGRLFDRFYRADKARTFSGSFGIGLSIAQSIVKKHRGCISVYKKDGIIGFRAELK